VTPLCGGAGGEAAPGRETYEKQKGYDFSNGI
jgi:hypothetical protein